MDQSKQKSDFKKQLFIKQTPIIVNQILKQLKNKEDRVLELKLGSIIDLQDIEKTAKLFEYHEIAHISKTLQAMLCEEENNYHLPLYMEQPFLLLLDEILVKLETPSHIQQRLPKIKNQNLINSIIESNKNDVQKVIMVIDDDLLFLNKVSSLLVDAGYIVLKSHRGKQAIQMFKETTPDCVIAGINIDDMKPLLFIESIQKKIANSFVPLIVVGDQTSKHVIEKVRFSIDDYLIKPFLMDDLLIKMVRLMERATRLKSQVNTDELTGIYSRKYIMEKLEYYFGHTSEKDHTHALAIFDLDYFKLVNDKHGHQMGDKVLIHFAKFISNHIRNTDIFARYGGEEFILLFPHTTSKEAWIKLNRLREEYSKQPITIDDIVIKQTFSGGIISNKDILSNNPVKLLNLADLALYEAKKSGRNQFLTYHERMENKNEKFKILIADDDRFTRKILKDGLINENWSLSFARNGLEAIEVAKRDRPNLILLDGLMPIKSGYEVLEEMRNNIRFKETAIIMLTGNHSDENVARALDGGADDYITKPFSMVELKARVNRFLVRHQVR